MQHLSFLLLLLFNTVLMENTHAQSRHKEKMKSFTSWIGRWQGNGEIRMGPGEPKRSVVDERIESKLDGTLLLIEGIGKSTDPITKQENIAHHALAILSYDQTSEQYKFNSYLQDGRSTQAWFNVLEENKYQWGFEAGGNNIRYSITLDPIQHTWNEVGEFSRDKGTTWLKFFEMNLKKTE
jgi:hypothetical protein